MRLCGKKAFKTEAAALKFIAIIQAQETADLWAYRCVRCGGFHMTSASPEKFENRLKTIRKGKVDAAANELKKAAKARAKAEKKNSNNLNDLNI